MAEGRKFTRNVIGASEEIYDYICSPCEESGVYKEAHKYCDNCKLYYCKKCLGDHNKFPALRGHLIKEATSQPKQNDQTGVTGVSALATSTEPCENHPEEMIKMYCGEHDVVCCTVCIALDHRECKEVHYILKLAKDIRTSQEYFDYVEDVTRIKTAYEDTKQSIQYEIKTLSKVKSEIINKIKGYKIELVSKIEELERKSLEKVNERYKQITDKMSVTAGQVDVLLDKVTKLVRDIDSISETQLFVQMKNIRQIKIENDMTDKEIEMFEGFSFSPDDNIRDAIDGADGLVIANLPLRILSKKEYAISLKGDKFDSIRGLCIMDDGDLILTHGKKLKRLNRSFETLSSVSTSGKLWGICKTSRSNELAIAIHSKQTIQFVQCNTKTMSLTEYFKVGVSCKGVCCRGDYLYVTCGGGDQDNVPGHLRQYDMEGNILCTMDTDKTGRRVFTSPRLMTLDSSTNNIYIADRDNGIIVIDRTGNIESHSYDFF